jgi:hypothetical protein
VPDHFPLLDAAQRGHHSLLAGEHLRGHARLERLAQEEREQLESQARAAEPDAVLHQRRQAPYQQVEEEVRNEDHEGEGPRLVVLVGIERVEPEHVERRHDEDDEQHGEEADGSQGRLRERSRGIPVPVREPGLVGMACGQLLAARPPALIDQSGADQADARRGS